MGCSMNSTTLSKKSISDRFLQTVFYFKLCWGQAYSYIGIPLKVMQLVLLISANIGILKLTWGIELNPVLVGFICLSGVIFIIGFGAFFVRFKIIDREHSFNNQFNPEFMHIYKNSKK